MLEDSVKLQSQEEARILMGPLDGHARLLRDLLQVTLVPRGASLKLLGPAEGVAQAKSLVQRALHEVRSGKDVTSDRFRGWVLEMVSGRRGKGRVAPRTPGQERYLRGLREEGMVFAIGPAGTGKTYLAVGVACEKLAEGKFRKMILTRPAVRPGRGWVSCPAITRPRSIPTCGPSTTPLERSWSRPWRGATWKTTSSRSAPWPT